jgi:Bor protein
LRTRSLVAAALALALSACHAVRYDAGRPASHRRWETTVHFFLWGLAGKPTVDLDAACPEGVASFRNEAGALHWIAEVATVGLWSPRRVVVECAEVAR